MVINIESFYQSKNSLRIDNSLNNPIDQENELYIELNEYLFDIIETIKGELKNISRTRQNNWKELKKKPRILSKYLNINSDSKYNLEINKINTSNIDIIIESLNSLIEKDMDKDNTNIKEEKLQYIFITVINKYLCENNENIYYLDLLWKLSTTYKSYFDQLANKLTEILNDEDSNITELLEFKIGDKILEIKQYQYGHLGSILSFFQKVNMVSDEVISQLLVKNNESINSILEWKPINKLVLEFRISILLNFMSNSVNEYYQKLDNDKKSYINDYLDITVNNNLVPIKIKANIIELVNKLSQKKKKEDIKKESFRKQDNKQELLRRQEPLRRQDDKQDNTNKWSRRSDKNTRNNDKLSKKNNYDMKGNTHNKGKNMDFKRSSDNYNNNNNNIDSYGSGSNSRKSNNVRRRSGRRNTQIYEKKTKSEYEWVQV